MKKVLLLMLLMGGAVLSTSAQWGHDRGRHRGWYRDDDRRYDRYERSYYRDRDCRRGWDDDYYRPRRRVVYMRPAYYPVVPVPVPPPPVIYPARPRVAFHAGVTIVN
ncbi:MAG TPA: hypothetical protein VM802_31490 [Chitinophaga sp.]|uniref:hypothetical protein n=1 Tax=Chitinophaga sp. TaxID=1869181 RepID=UPI002B564F4D|nr:hypothetical protein [Chitinophaga sp.]HVI49432.1 hypothetical protein [Chitinophaga sp.]